MRTLFVLGWLSTGAVMAAPATYKKSGPDPQGVSTFWVKCENGNVSTVACLRDDAHCGAEHRQSLVTAAVMACESIQGLTMVPGK